MNEKSENTNNDKSGKNREKKLFIMLDNEKEAEKEKVKEDGKAMSETKSNIGGGPSEEDQITKRIAIAKRLNQFAKNNFESKAEFLEKLNVSSEEALEYFSYKKPLSREFLTKLSSAGCDINWLLNGDEEEVATTMQDEGSVAASDTVYEDDFEEADETYPDFSNEMSALKYEVSELNKKNDQLRNVIIKMEKAFSEKMASVSLTKSTEIDDDKLNKVNELSIKQLKKIMVENFGTYQKNVVNQLFSEEFLQILKDTLNEDKS